MNSLPSISIIVAVRNAAATLAQCLDSVLAQSYVTRELIVIDGGSTDGSRELIEERADRISYWISEPDQGIYHAWNKGLARAKGEWVCFLCADDYLWERNTLERLARVLALAHLSARVVYGRVSLVNAEGRQLQLLGEPWPDVQAQFRQIMCLPHTALMHHRSLFERHGHFDESFRIGGDYELLLRELVSGNAMLAQDITVAAMRHGGVSSHPAKSLEMILEFRRAQRLHGLGRPGRTWIAAWLRGHIRVRLWKLLGPRNAPKVFDFVRAVLGKEAYWMHH
jgi:GT2 family glycosyltransferase